MAEMARIGGDVTAPTRNGGRQRWDEERYRTLFDLGPVAVYSVDADGVIQEFNRRAVELWGCEPILGDTEKRFCGAFRLFRPDGTYLPHQQCPMAAVVAGTLAEARDGEVLIERPDGSRITVIVNIRPFKNEHGDVTGAINCFYDITSRKHTEEALRQSLEDMTLMQRVSTRLLRGGDFSLLLHEILDAAIEIAGAQMGNIRLLDGDVLRIAAQRGFEEPFLEFFDAVHGGQATCGTAWQRGERVIVDDVVTSDIFEDSPTLEVMLAAGARAVQSTPLVSRSGRVLGMFSTHWNEPQQPSDRALRLLDILARQAADLIEHEEGQEARARTDEERTRLLASEHAARTQAEEANHAKDQFLATASHELRTPLNAILGWAAILERSASLDDRTLKGLQSINRNTRTLAQLVEDLLDVSRMISGKMGLDVTRLDLGDVIEAAVETILPAASAKDIGIHVTIDPASRSMVGDATRLQQMVWNLLSNAVKFTAPGGRIEVETRADNGNIEVTVTDSGVGIDAAFLPFVFDRFRQADVSSTRTHTGLGLGLAIVRHLVELHGGRVRAESAGRNTGTRFVLQLPREQPHPPTLDARKPSGIPAASGGLDLPRFDGLRILIVDDDRETCEMMLEALRGFGASVWCATSATEAIRQLPQCLPDLVLSDIAMPGRDGYAVLSEIRQVEMGLGRRVPVAAVSAYAHEEDRQRAIAAGFDLFLAKPVESAALASTVRALVAIAKPARLNDS